MSDTDTPRSNALIASKYFYGKEWPELCKTLERENQALQAQLAAMVRDRDAWNRLANDRAMQISDKQTLQAKLSTAHATIENIREYCDKNGVGANAWACHRVLSFLSHRPPILPDENKAKVEALEGKIKEISKEISYMGRTASQSLNVILKIIERQ